MPAQKQMSGILAKLGNRLAQAFEKHKSDDTEYGQIELPSGIENGIAMLTACGFGQYKTGEGLIGEPFWRAQASILRPKVFIDDKGRKHRTEGKHASIGPEPLCDTPKRSRKTLDEHVAWILNELRKMGVNTKDLSWESFEMVCAALIDPKNPTYIKFRTWKGEATTEFPNPRVNVQFTGPADASELEDDEEEEEDVTEAPSDTLPKPQLAPPKINLPGKNGTAPTSKPTANGPAAKKPTMTPTPGKPGTKPTSKPAPAPEPEPTNDDYTDQGDLDSLAELAGQDDQDAKDRLAEMAKSQGFTDDQIESCPSWETLVEAMKTGEDASTFTWEAGDGAESGDEEETPAEDGEQAEWAPAVGELYLFKPNGPNGKKVAKAVEVEVLSVNPKNKTVDLKNVAKPTIKYGKAGWDELEANNE